MENIDDTSFESQYTVFQKELEELKFIDAVKNYEPIEIAGLEALSLGESIGLFFSEFGTMVDKKVGLFARPVHMVDNNKLRNMVSRREINFVRHSAVPITVPTNYTPGIANMMAHVKGAVEGVYLLGSLRTETTRLYDFLKQMIKTGRSDKRFKWTINNLDESILNADSFVKQLPDEQRRLKVPLSEVYVNFNEMLEVIDVYNTSLKTLSARDVEIVARELTNTYHLGELLIEKIKSNELTFERSVLTDLELTVNNFVRLVDIAGAMMTLLNELSAVFREQIKEVVALKD